MRKQDMEEALRHTFHDALAGLPNLFLLIDGLNYAIEQAKRSERLKNNLFLTSQLVLNVFDDQVKVFWPVSYTHLTLPTIYSV